MKKLELGASLLKLHAEVRMLGNLLIAFALLTVLSIFYKLSFLPIFLILAYLSFSYLKRHNTLQFMGLLNNVYTLQKFESEESAKEAKNKE